MKKIKNGIKQSLLLLGVGVILGGCGPVAEVVEIEEVRVTLEEFNDRQKIKAKEAKSEAAAKQTAAEMLKKKATEEAQKRIDELVEEKEKEQTKVAAKIEKKSGDDYYQGLIDQCDPESNCCKTSAQKMQTLGVRLAENGECKDGLKVTQNRCFTSYKWCE